MLSLDEFTSPPEELPPGDTSAPTTPGMSSMSVARFRAAARARMASEGAEESVAGSPRSRRTSTLEPFLVNEEGKENPYFKDATAGNGGSPIASYSPISPGVIAARSRGEELAQLEAQMKNLPRTLNRMKSEDSVSSLNAASGPSTPNKRWEAGPDRSMSSASSE